MEGQIQAQIHLALAICAHDGFISDTEVASLRGYYCGAGKVTEDELETLVDEFFEHDFTLEQLFAAVEDKEFTLGIAAEAASADGLDIRENFALERCRQFIAENSRGEV